MYVTIKNAMHFQLLLSLHFFLVIQAAVECAHQNEDLAEMVMELKSQFRLLANCVQCSLEKENIERLKNHVRLLLKDNLGTTLKRYNIEAIQNVEDLFKFLVEHNYISYLNYEVLCEYAEMVRDDEVIKTKVKTYIEKYNKFIEDPVFAELIQVFINHPELRPTEVIGLPRIVVRIVHDARKESLGSWKTNSWETYVKSKRAMIQNISTNSIVLTYAIFPTDLVMIVNNIQSSQAKKHFQEMGVSVTIPKATQDSVELLTKVHIIIVIACQRLSYSLAKHTENNLSQYTYRYNNYNYNYIIMIYCYFQK